MTPLFGCPVQVSSSLQYGKKAVKLNGIIYVSPAMHELMKGTDSDELEKLFRAIELVDMDKFSNRTSL